MPFRVCYSANFAHLYYRLMIGASSGWADTIVALATPQGIGAIGVIRVSGPNAIYMVNQLFPSKDLAIQPSHTLHVGVLTYQGAALDEVVLSLFKNPRSYTGEDVVEISCHGSGYIQQQILQVLVQSGARLAKPGEFTQRAFLNGKLDLSQAEAVADLIASNTEASKRTALRNMRGGFSAVLKDLREQIIQFSALIELELDFAQEDVEFADRGKFEALLTEAAGIINMLLQSFTLGNVIKNGVQVAIIGKPNAGKSTLLNALLKENRAIVSDIAGTTRDTIEETININGILFRLIDTAGIREHASGIIEEMGIEKSLEKMRNADIVLYLFDVNETSKEELVRLTENIESDRLLLIGNKSERMNPESLQKKFEPRNDIIYISAREQLQIDVLKDKLYNMVVDDTLFSSETIVTNARHVEALTKVNQCVAEIQNGLALNIPGDLLALEIRACLHYLGEITGEITNEDKLDYIFSKFCIGK